MDLVRPVAVLELFIPKLNRALFTERRNGRIRGAVFDFEGCFHGLIQHVDSKQVGALRMLLFHPGDPAASFSNFACSRGRTHFYFISQARAVEDRRQIVYLSIDRCDSREQFRVVEQRRFDELRFELMDEVDQSLRSVD